MKTLIPIIVVFFAISVLAQEMPKAMPVDAFGRIHCDELGARASNLLQGISKSGGHRGFVIAYPQLGARARVVRQFRQIMAQFEFANLEDRVDFVLGEEGSETRYEFWSVPDEAKEPDYNGQKWLPPTPDLSKPFIFDYEDENGECPTFVPRKFAELLQSRPTSRANIVVQKGGKFSSPVHGFADQWVDELVGKFGISRKRLKVYYAKRGSGITYAEFWFVPGKSK